MRIRSFATLAALALALPTLATAAQKAPADPPINACPVGGFPAISCPVVNDDVIRQAVSQRLAGSVITKWTHVTVSVHDGVVTLSGTVESQSQANLGSILARTVRGVAGVQNRLYAAPGELGDVALIGRVRRALSGMTLPVNGVTVDASDGIVQLRGMVASDYVGEQAGLTAASVPGVTAVHNNIVVKDPGAFGF
jgi:hyperosmotically inducible protein